jgi:TPP-dependent 2-oxoacid decarboxylase
MHIDPSDATTVPEFLVRRFRELGIDQGFGIVGDFALRLFGHLHDMGFPICVAADEQGAAFAADAYARLRGFGVCAVTYSVGGLKVVNATAGAWAEQVPLLIISGAPGIKERQGDPMLHHKVKNFETQLDVFRDITIAQAVITNPLTATEEIDRVLGEMLATQRPGYIEIPRDMVDVLVIDRKESLEVSMPPVHAKRLELAVNETLDLLEAAQNPVAVAGVMAVRRHLGDSLVAFAEQFGIPMAKTSLSRGAFSERHPMSLGVYMGAVSPTEVVERVEAAEPLITFGVPFADLVMGGFTHHLDRGHLIECTDTQVNIGYHSYQDVPLWAFLPALIEAATARQYHRNGEGLHHQPTFAPADGNPALTVERVMACVASVIDDRFGLLIEPGDSLFASVELAAPAWGLSSAYYATMGYAVPAALGAGLADPKRRPLILVGDGAFLMTGLELLSAVHHGINPIVVIADNGGYGTQRPMLDGPFNDVPALAAEHLPAVFGTGQGFLCDTESELHEALKKSVATNTLSIIRARIPKGKYSPALIRLTDALRKKI